MTQMTVFYTKTKHWFEESIEEACTSINVWQVTTKNHQKIRAQGREKVGVWEREGRETATLNRGNQRTVLLLIPKGTAAHIVGLADPSETGDGMLGKG